MEKTRCSPATEYKWEGGGENLQFQFLRHAHLRGPDKDAQHKLSLKKKKKKKALQRLYFLRTQENQLFPAAADVLVSSLVSS